MENPAGKARRFLLTTARVLRLVWKGFLADRCNLQASALTYYTLMSLVPLLAFGLSLARVFGAGDLAKEMVSGKIAEFCEDISKGASSADPALAGQLAAQVNGYAGRIFDGISGISFNTLGALGLVALLWMAIAMLGNVEQSFNSVWHAPPRTLWRKVSDYVTIILVVPFLAVAASSIPVFAKLTALAEGCAPGFLSTELVARLLRAGTSFALMVALFTVVLVFVPNTKVRLGPGVVGGIATALAFAAWLRICTALQIGVAKNSAIYGGFAAIPILLAWTYVSWQIMLFGTELTLAVQRHESFLRDEGASGAGARARALLALALVVEMARRMAARERPLDVAGYAKTRGISDRLALDIMDALVATGLAAETAEGGDGDRYVLLRSPDRLTVGEALGALSSRGTPPEKLGLDNVDHAVVEFYARMEGEASAARSTTVADLAAACAATEWRPAAAR